MSHTQHSCNTRLPKGCSSCLVELFCLTSCVFVIEVFLWNVFAWLIVNGLIGVRLSVFSAGCIVTSDTRVLRDQFYDGRSKAERASIVLRIAQTFLRYCLERLCLENADFTVLDSNR